MVLWHMSRPGKEFDMRRFWGNIVPEDEDGSHRCVAALTGHHQAGLVSAHPRCHLYSDTWRRRWRRWRT